MFQYSSKLLHTLSEISASPQNCRDVGPLMSSAPLVWSTSPLSRARGRGLLLTCLGSTMFLWQQSFSMSSICWVVWGMRGTSSGLTSPRSFISFSRRTNPESLGTSSPVENLLITGYYPGYYPSTGYYPGYYLSTGYYLRTTRVLGTTLGTTRVLGTTSPAENLLNTGTTLGTTRVLGTTCPAENLLITVVLPEYCVLP